MSITYLRILKSFLGKIKYGRNSTLSLGYELKSVDINETEFTGQQDETKGDFEIYFYGQDVYKNILKLKKAVKNKKML